jgi:hypothetical protein
MYLLTAIVLLPGGSTVIINKQAVYRTYRGLQAGYMS